MTKPQAARVVSVLVAAYPVPSWTEETIKLYAHDIGPFSYAAAAAAVGTWRRSRDERPTINQLRKAIGAEQAAVEAAAMPKALPPVETPEAMRRIADDFDALGEQFKGGRFGFKSTFADLANKVRARAKRIEEGSR